MHLYLARELSAIEGYAGPEVDEHLEVRRLPWREAVAMAAAGEIRDAKSLVGLLHIGLLAEAGGLDLSGGLDPSRGPLDQGASL